MPIVTDDVFREPGQIWLSPANVTVPTFSKVLVLAALRPKTSKVPPNIASGVASP